MSSGKICEKCGVNRKSKYGKKYCLKCSIEVKKEQEKEYRLRHKKTKYCRVCGVEISGVKYHKYCSDECYDVYFKQYSSLKSKRYARRKSEMWKKLSDNEKLKRMQKYMLDRLR